jgi:hypothetical protein
MTLGAPPQAGAADAAPPSAIERALADRACISPAILAADADTRQHCIDTQLVLLRDAFGVDLKRLTAAERNALDSSCRRLETTHGRDSYLDCVNAQLIAMRARRAVAAAPRTTASDLASAAVATSTATQPDTVSVAAAATPPIVARSTATAGAALLVIAAVAALSLVVIRRRRTRRTCRDCGVVVDAGDLCAACRRAAAESLRRAASERMEQVRVEEAERRRKLQLEDDARQQALREEQARAAELQEAQRREENARRERDEDARRRSLLVAAPPRGASAQDEFDPYAVLGVPRDTTPEDLRTAYEQARSKYDQDTVAHLGVDVQEHFREKAQAVDRAYHMLAG